MTALDRLLVHSRHRTSLIERQLSDNALRFKHGNFIYGGWRHPLGHWEPRPHLGLVKFHEACKALFCPICEVCKKHSAVCRCAKSVVCWRHVGQAPKDEGTKFHCALHGEIPWRKALFYTEIAALPANQWAKTEGGSAEFFAWIIGRRPWDDTLTAPRGSGRVWIIVCQTLSTSGALNIEEKIREYLSAYIIRARKNSSGGVNFWEVRSSDGGTDKLKLVSQDQHHNTKAEVSPLEGAHFYAVWGDEPMDAGIKSALNRGLKPGKEKGWGRLLETATYFEGSPEARIEIAENVWQKAWVNGGTERSLFAMSGRIEENPANTPENIRQTIDRWPAHERKARAEGIMEFVTGRVFPEFDAKVHTYDPGVRSVLSTRDSMLLPPHERHKHPSTLPVFMAADPHDKRPWAMVWVAIGQDGEWYVVDEWPKGDFARMTHYSDAGVENRFESYAKVIDDVEAAFPGGKRRVLKRFMDKRFASQEKVGSHGLTAREAMRRLGFNFQTDYSVDGGHEILTGNSMVREKLLGSWSVGKELTELCKPHLYVAETCRNVLWSFLYHVHRDEGKTDKSRERLGEAGKDHLDCLRYLAMAKLRYRGWEEAHADIAAQISSLRFRMEQARR